MGKVLGIGTGLFILAFLWVVCIFACVAFTRAQGGIANAGVGTILLAIVVTLILWFIPRGPGDLDDYTIYDNMYIARTTVISVCGVFVLVALGIMVVFHVFEQQTAKPLKRIR